MRLLVTGGAGFIGSNFINYWLEKYPKDFIINLDLMTYAANPLTVKYHKARFSNYEFVKGDICYRNIANDLVEKVDIIVHFAAESHVDKSITGPFPFIRTNVEGTLNLLEAAREAGGVRFHHISTDEVCGSLPENDPKAQFNERTPYHPRNPYSASKAAADHLVRAYFETHKLPVTISNCSNNYGPFQFPEKLIPLTITRALYNQKIPVYGDGKQRRDWIHVFDHVRGIELIIKKGKIGETYWLGGDGERFNIDIVKRILKILGKSENLIKYVGDRKGHDRRYSVDYSYAKKTLGFKPENSIDKWLELTVDWYIKNKKWWRPLKTEADKVAQKYLKCRI